MPRSQPLTSEEIHTALASLPKWETIERTPPGSDHSHAELHRILQFSSFGDAMHFMQTASRFIQMSDHHPSWQNTYSKVEVWITTGELKHRLSVKDVALAHYLDRLFLQYQSPSS